MPDRNPMQNHEPLLSVRQINKRFPGVHALKDVTFSIATGEVHAVIGENGAGKSTLMRILSGVHSPDSGDLAWEGDPIAFGSPTEAFSKGIAMVWQDTRLVPTLDVAWNIFLGHEPGGALIADRRQMNIEAQRLLDKIGSRVDPKTPAGDLSRAEMQQVEIARALSRNARLLILDEPTSALTPAETAGLFQLVATLRDEGCSIIFISHRLPEVMEISDRVTVLKDGAVVGTVASKDTDSRQLVAMMVGREMGLVFPPRNPDSAANPLALSVDRLVTPATAVGSPGLTFNVHKGEIVGFGGIEGSGQQAAARALFGIGKNGGKFSIEEDAVNIRSPSDAIAEGLIYIPADRRSESLFSIHSIRENAAVPNLSSLSLRGTVDRAREERAVVEQMDRLAVKAPTMETLVGTLSGGNQQKVVFARWLIGEARVAIFDEPTQGVDVGTKQEIYSIIRAMANDGVGVIVISSDLPELIGLTDRILVFNDGGIVADIPSEDATEERVIGAAVEDMTATNDAQKRGRSDQPTSAQAVPTKLRNAGMLRRYGSAFLLAALIMVMIAVASAFAPYFLTPRNFGSMAGQIAPVAFAAIGQMATILLGGIDLSIGPTISLVTSMASYVLSPDSGLPIWLGILVCLLAGVTVGCVNGFLTAVMRIPDLVATLATFTIVQGVALISRPSPGGRVDPDVADAITNTVGRLPFSFILVVLVVVIAEILLARGKIGARFYAVGSSLEAARASGINAGRLRFVAYVFSGFMAALAGLIIAARIGSGDPQAGTTFTLASVTAVVIGGTSVFGGIGTAIGTFLGAILIILMQNILNQFQINAYWQYVWTGVLTLLAVGFHSVRSPERRSRMFLAARGFLTHRRRPNGNPS